MAAGTCAAAAGAAAPAVAAAAATVALTSFSVRTRGGFDVMMVALSRSPSRKSVSCAGLPSRIIFTPRLSTSPCENILIPSSVRTTMLEPERCMTVPFFTSVTVTGVTVVRVVIVAVPFMPGFNWPTDNDCPLTMNRKSSGTSSSFVPSGSLTISWLPTTLMTSKLLVSVAVDVCCASDTLAVAHTTAARIIQLITRVIDSLHF